LYPSDYVTFFNVFLNSHFNGFSRPQQQQTHQPQPTPISQPHSQTPLLNPQGEMLYRKVKINQISYTILKTLGKGGSGKVYQAIRDDTGSMCAIKEIDLSADMNSESAIQDEISLLQRLSTSPRVIKLLDQQSRFDLNIWYIVLELGSNDFGHILQQQLQEYKSNFQQQQQQNGQQPGPIPHCGGLTVTQLCHYWEQILSGVQTCHDINILHLDLKPANFVMIDGSMKLIDFGIAKAKNAEFTSVIQSNIMGTISYISPEQLSSIEQKGAKVRPSSDVWALGCIFHQMVFGYTPYAEHKQAFQRIAAISSPQPYNIPTIPTFITGGDTELELLITDVLRLCLQKDPKNRPTVEDLLLHPLLHPHSRKEEKYKHLFPTTSQSTNADPTRVLTAMKNVMKEQMDLYKAKDSEKPNVLTKEFIALMAQGGNWKILTELLSTQLNNDGQ
jgi:serine/threonine-protein kinase TTK/MPS1